LQLAIRSWPELQLSAIERPLRTRGGGEILGYEDKYVGSEGMTSAPRELPAQIAAWLEQRIRLLAPEVASLVGLRGVARLDFLSDGEDVFITRSTRSRVRSLTTCGSIHACPSTSLMLDLLAEANPAPRGRYSSVGSDGSALRLAGSIASKLG